MLALSGTAAPPVARRCGAPCAARASSSRCSRCSDSNSSTRSAMASGRPDALECHAATPARAAASHRGGVCPPDADADATCGRRAAVAAIVAGVGAVRMAVAPPANAIEYGLDYKKELARRRRKIPEEEFTEGPEGLKLYDIVAGTGAEAKVGERVAVHYDVKFRNVTFITSRQGMGVTGGTPVGFNVGTKDGESGSTLPGIDLGVRGMRVGGVRRLIVPPNLAYGERGVGEIPPNATLNIDVELLSIKTSPLGYRTKLVEG